LRSRVALLAFVVASARLGFAQDQHSSHQIPVVPAELLHRQVAIRSGIGAAHDAVSTNSREAQAFYDQGLAYLHSYVWVEAARSFNQALRLDAKLAMAHCELSIAYTELNAPKDARAALDLARALAASDHDRRHLDLRSLQMAAEAAPGDIGKLAAYRKQLDEALSMFPADEELWLLRGLAESPDPAERGQGGIASSRSFYEQALKLAPKHFAGHHYLAHAYENTGRIDDALAQAAAYVRMAPAIPHAHHMAGHNLRRVGRIDDAIAEFEAADRLGSDYLKAERIPVEYEWHYHHNLDLLATSYQYVGRVSQAEQLLKRAFTIPSNLVVQEINKREWPVFLLARGRADEALAAAMVLVAHPSPLVRATGHVEAGEAMLSTGKFQKAADESNAALAELKRAPDGGALVATSLAQLQGGFFLRTGQRDKGRAALQQVMQKVRAATGPDAWTQGLFTLEAIARAALEVGDWELADRAAGQMREHDPAYAGTHYALALVAEHRGDREASRSEFELALKYWSRADRDLPELADVRARLAKTPGAAPPAP
jgi:tetratricopeptide (TPR) repeat protein